MKAIVLHEIGGPQNLHLEDVDMPIAKPGEVIVKITRAAFNRRPQSWQNVRLSAFSRPQTSQITVGGDREACEWHRPI